jgi:hypothetical protein
VRKNIQGNHAQKNVIGCPPPIIALLHDPCYNLVAPVRANLIIDVRRDCVEIRDARAGERQTWQQSIQSNPGLSAWIGGSDLPISEDWIAKSLLASR